VGNRYLLDTVNGDLSSMTKGMVNMAKDYPTIIIGSGPTGLSAAYHLDEDHLILERDEKIGGLNKSVSLNGFTFDYAGHILFTNDDYARAMFQKLLGTNVHYQVREAWCYQQGAHTLYPFQANTYGLPEEVVRDCVAGAVRAFLEYGDVDPKNFRDFREWNRKTYGEGICKHFQEPYNEKLWKVPLETMSHEWLSGRVPKPKIEQIIQGALQPGIKNMGPNALFGYPLRGGFQALVDGWRNLLDVEMVRTSQEVTRIDLRRRTVTVRCAAGGRPTDRDGREYGFRRLITTMPLPMLVRALEDAPADVRAAGESLQWTSIQCVFIGLDRPHITDKHWIYYPEPDLYFHRIFVQGNASPFNNPTDRHGNPQGTAYIAEISYRGAPAATGGVAIEKTLEGLKKVGLMADGDQVLAAQEIRMPFAYVIPQWHKDSAVRTIQEYLAQHDVYTVGRFGEWAYFNTDHAILSGKRAADAIKERKRKRLTISVAPIPGATEGAASSAGAALEATGKV
jgi:UDP-galactopyranose mutase